MKQKPIAVKLSHVSKKYIVHHEKPTLVEKLINGRDEAFWALKDINLQIIKGERVGIIGPNGSGKTTLLKLITGISFPTSGKIETNGKIVSLIDVQAGFHEDMTGVQNIYLNGMLLGMNKKEISNKLTDIIGFADIGKFIDVPLYTYSSGMALRLGFSIALYSNPDILILDENLNVGDQNFQEKVKEKMREFLMKEITVVFVSHWLEFIENNCKQLIVLDKGKIIYDGNVSAISKYKKNEL